MPLRFARTWRAGWLLGILATVSGSSAVTLAGQELKLLRVYPGSGPYECLAPASPELPTPDARARAGQLASDANQALILGELEQVQALLEQAVTLDPASPDLAYRHARVLEDVDRAPDAMVEYCRAFSKAVDTTAAEMTGVDRYGSEMSAQTAKGPRPIRLAFSKPIATGDDARGEMVSMVKRAREILAAG